MSYSLDVYYRGVCIWGKKVEFLLNLSSECSEKQLCNIHFRRLIINNVKTDFKPKRECCTFEVADVGDYLKNFLSLTVAASHDRNSKIWRARSVLSLLKTGCKSVLNR